VNLNIFMILVVILSFREKKFILIVAGLMLLLMKMKLIMIP